MIPGHNSLSRDNQHDMIAQELSVKSWCVVNHYFAPALLEKLRARLGALHEANRLTQAGIGRGGDNASNPAIRRDVTEWLNSQNPVEAELLDEMEILRVALNARLMLGLFYYEAHFALYEPGAFYKRHVDAFRGEKNRIISTVLYLNPDWKQADGGLLAMYDSETATTPFLSVPPEMGVLVLFLSEEIPHEVTTAHAGRASIAGWFRCNDRQVSPALQVSPPVL